MNGNIVAYAGIKEGNTFSETFNVTAALSTIANSTAQGLTITQANSDYYYSSCANRRNAILFTFSGGMAGLTNVTLNVQYIYPLPTPPGGYQTINRTGLYTYASGDKYVGELKEGMFHGQGTFTFANGIIKKGLWKNDEFVGE